METLQKYYCYNCFQERSDEAGPCPHCGFDLEVNAKKFPVALRAGTVLNNRYIVGRILGQGGFGITYLALDTELQAKVAIKEFMPSDIATRMDDMSVAVMMKGKADEFAYGAERFLEEARTLAKFIGNPNIAGVSSYFDENGTSYFVMDYIEGIPFKTYIANHGGKVSIDDALNVMIPVLRALTAVHAEGFIHRDVTPDNIYISKDGNVKLLDFGSARYSIGDKSKSLDVVLKVGYAPKEQYIRRGRQGPYTDVYSCAACLYAAITGYLPPESLERLDQDTLVPVSQMGIDIPAYLDNAILKGLAVQPEDRFQSAAEFLDAIESQTVVEVPAGNSRESVPVPEKKKPKTALIGGIAAAVLAVAVGVSMLGGGSGSGGNGGGNKDKDDRPLIKAEVPSITIAGQEYSTKERGLDLSGRGLTDADIQDLKYMVNLESLQLDGNDITDLTPLAGLTQLHHLTLSGDMPVDTSTLAGLTALTNLNFNNSGSDSGWIDDLSWMSGMSKLEYAWLPVGNLTSLAGLEGATALQTLQIQGDLQVTDLSPLSALTELTELSIYGGGGAAPVFVKDLSSLSDLTKLNRLNISVMGLESLNGIQNMTELRELQIRGGSGSGVGTLWDVSALAGLTGLTFLDLMNLAAASDLAPLSGLTGLTKLRIFGEFDGSNLSFLSGMTELRELSCSGDYENNNTRDLTALKDLTKLQTLNITVGPLESLEGLENLTELTSLDIGSSGPCTFTDTTPLKNLTKLRNLRLPNRGTSVKTYCDLSGLAGMTDLQTLDFSGRIVSLEPLAGLTNLRSLDLNDQGHPHSDPPLDLTPLANLKNVSDMTLQVDRCPNVVAVGQMTGLRSLILNVGNGVTDLSPLANLENLSSASIYAFKVTDWSPVEHVPDLTKYAN